MSINLSLELPQLPPPPRKVRYLPVAWVFRGFFVVSFATLFVLLPGARTERYLQLKELAASGITVTGTITNAYVRPEDQTEYVLDYAFTYEGKQYNNSADVSQELYNATTVGATTTIYILPSHPGVQHVGPVSHAVLTESFNKLVEVSFVVLLLLLGIIFTIDDHFRRQYALLRCGLPVAGTIARVLSKSKDQINVEVEYLVGGQTFLKKYLLFGKRRLLYAQGDPIVILYDPSNPKESLPYDNIKMVALRN